MSETFDLRPLLWVASSKRDFIEMPEEVVGDFGHWLFLVQKGKKPKNAKSLTGFGGAQVMELWRDHGDGTFRTVFTVRYAEIVGTYPDILKFRFSPLFPHLLKLLLGLRIQVCPAKQLQNLRKNTSKIKILEYRDRFSDLACFSKEK